MAKVRVAGFGVSVDGFAAGIEQSLDDPLGKRGPELFQWFFPTRSFREMHGESGGETGPDNEFARRAMEGLRTAGAVIETTDAGFPWKTRRHATQERK